MSHINETIRTYISRDEVTSICRKFIHSSSIEILNYDTRPFCDEPFGYLSIHDLLTVEVLYHNESLSQNPKKRETKLTFFVKRSLPSPTANEKRVFAEECKFFRDTVPQQLKNFKSELWTAECYLAKENLLVMEDLRVRGFKIPSNVCLTDNQLVSAVASLARFHASSLLLEAKLRKPLNEVYSGHFEEKVLNAEGLGRSWFSAGIEVVEAVAASLGLEVKYARTAFGQSLSRIKPVPGQRNVLSHGDIWCNNMMFRDEKDETTSCRLVDFQMVTYRFYAIDFVQFLYLNADHETRRKLEKHLARVYFDVMDECLRSHNYTGRMPNLTEMMKDLQETRVVGMVSAALIFPIALLNGKLKVEYTKNQELFKHYMHVSRKDFVLNAFKVDDEYKMRIVEIVKELTEFTKNNCSG